jgi:hypothetical protein
MGRESASEREEGHGEVGEDEGRGDDAREAGQRVETRQRAGTREGSGDDEEWRRGVVE